MIGPVMAVLAVVGAQRHPVEGGGVACSQFSFYDDPVARRRHTSLSMPDDRRSLGPMGGGSPG